jgi:4-amino-4-deoxy-L-arabinose transferase-like glycosyltransferase
MPRRSTCCWQKQTTLGGRSQRFEGPCSADSIVADKRSCFGELQRSFAAVYAALEDPRTARRVVVVLLIIHTGLLGYSACVHSPTLNEPGHLVAGLSHWRFGRFELYRVNPPLVRMVAALPVMAVGYDEDWSGFYEGPGVRPEFSMGKDFVAANGERSFFLFMIARWACIPFSWIGAIVCYLWARDLYGRPAGVLACTIWCFEPNVLAHASLITADAAATAFGAAACYLFWRWLKTPTWTRAGLTGVVLGIAELTKTTLILFYPLWPILWVLYRWSDRRSMVRRDWLREGGMLAVSLTIGIYVLNVGYGFEGPFKQLKEFDFVSDLFTGDVAAERRTDAAPSTGVSQPATSASRANRFAGTWLGGLPVPLPENYLAGIDVQQRDFEDFGRPSYLHGEWRNLGWWYYYLYACAIKVPLGLWLLAVLVVFARLISVFTPTGGGSTEEKEMSRASVAIVQATAAGQQPTASLRDEVVLLFPVLLIFAVVSAKTGFNEHVRYVVPAIPFFVIALSQVAGGKRLTNESHLPHNYMPVVWGVLFSSRRGGRRMPALLMAVVAFAGSWLVASSLWIYPHSLSYFNESIGGPLNGPRYLLGSNVDWGQDLRYLKSWVDGHPEARGLYVSHAGLLDPNDLGINCTWIRDQDDEMTPAETDHGWQAVSVNSYWHTYQRRVTSGSTGAQELSGQTVVYDSPRFSPDVNLGYSMILFRK